MANTNTGQHLNLTRWIIVAISGALLGVALMMVTAEIGRANLLPFVAAQRRYIIGIEAAFLGVFLVEMLVRVISYRLYRPDVANYGVRLRIMVRIVGYLIATLSIIAILASNPGLTISIGATVGVVVAFAVQNLAGNILSTVVLLNSRMIRVGEQITVTGVTGVVADITLTHTVISADGDVVYVPNTLMMGSAVRRKERVETGKGRIGEAFRR